MKNYGEKDSGPGKVPKKITDSRIVYIKDGEIEKGIKFFMKVSGRIQKERKKRAFHMTDNQERHKKEKYDEKRREEAARKRPNHRER